MGKYIKSHSWMWLKGEREVCVFFVCFINVVHVVVRPLYNASENHMHGERWSR